MSYEVESESSRYRRGLRLVRRRPAVGTGSIEKTRESGPVLFYKLFASPRVLRAGAYSWDLDSPSTTATFSLVESGRAARFSISSRGGEPATYTYGFRVRAWFAGIDPTYDGLAFDADHFLAHMTT